MRARDAGMEVVYEGIRLTPAEIVNAALEEGVHVVGLSILSGSHVPLVKDVVARMREAGLDDVPVMVGGIIPPEDASTLQRRGRRGGLHAEGFRAEPHHGRHRAHRGRRESQAADPVGAPSAAIACASAAGLTGFARNAFMPAASAASSSRGSLRPEMPMIGTRAAAPLSARIARVAASPSMPGSVTSISTRS